MARKSLRRSQVITPFGVGAIVDFPGQSLMSAGLDAWPDQPECRITDDRLARRLGVQFFRAPPTGRREGQRGDYLPFVRFPLWHFCPRCRALYPTSWNEPFPPRCSSPLGSRFKPKPGKKGLQPCSTLPEKKRWRMVPVRFVIACDHGHIDDFPWTEWAHTRPGQSLDQAQVCQDPQLRLNYTGKAGLMGLIVKCENEDCGAKPRSLMGSAGPNSLRGLPCSGNRPWLGPNGTEPCEAQGQPRMLQRGSTNLYFPKVASAILIPPFSDPIRKIVDDPHNWSVLTSGVEEDGSPDETRMRFFADLKRLDFGRLKDVVLQKLTGFGVSDSEQTEEEFRYSEYQALSSASSDSRQEFVTAVQDLDLYAQEMRKYLGSLVLVEKLAETRALTGFSRINPPPYREFDQHDQSQLCRTPGPWLPAIRVYGEGIFLTLNEATVEEWTSTIVEDRFADIIANHTAVYQRLGRTPRVLPPRFFLLHTLAHVLIRRLSFECGYGSSSLRERLYCWDEVGKEMTGLLIYTAAGDCEGTMGGLVQQGKPGRFEALLCGAIEDALWCSRDPLCIESRGQGIDSLNRAACHACTLLPETSCEEGNRFLDRAVLIGTPGNPSLGYFAEIGQTILAGAI